MSGGGHTFSDNDDVVIEEENIIYPEEDEDEQHHEQQSKAIREDNRKENAAMLINQLDKKNSQDIDSEELLKSFEILQLNSNNNRSMLTDVSNNKEHNIEDMAKKSVNLINQQSNVKLTNIINQMEEPPRKMVYRNKYNKINPNIIVDFAQIEPTMRAIKILFDWLRINHEILVGCYRSNPEFIHKIMKLLNYCNIDIFTRKVYFEREFLNTSNVRKNLSELFDMRTNVPLSEDFIFKSFDIFQSTQITLDWETTLRENITTEEESILRIFKMVDFGFFICKQQKFNYRFCVKSRRFTENPKKKREDKKSSRRRERRTAKNAARKRVEGRTRRYSDRKNGILRKSYTSNEEKDTVEECRKIPRKGYLRCRNADKMSFSTATISNAGATSASTTTTNSAICEKIQSSSGADEERSEAMTKKCEIMGKLWLKNEVETLEEEVNANHSNLLRTFLILTNDFY